MSMRRWRRWSPQPYVNHIPTMTGGVGHDELKRFYKYHFIQGNPPDLRLTPISRTVGDSQIVDEFIFGFTHTTVIDWMLPGVERHWPCGRDSRGRRHAVRGRQGGFTSISIGTRPRCSCRSACSIPEVCLSRAQRRRARSRTKTAAEQRADGALAGK